MKDTLKNLYRLLPVILLTGLTSCAVVEKSKLQWRHNGTVLSPHREVGTVLDNAYYAFDTPQGLYLAGFEIDNKGTNHPHLVFINKDLTGQIHWPQTEAVEQLFFYNKQLYLLDETGTTQVRNGKQWQQAPLTLTANSKIITSENVLIACVPSPLPSADYTRGHCYSVTDHWRVDIAWRSVTPVLCNNTLVAVSDYPSREVVHQIELSTGKIIKQISLPAIPPDLCTSLSQGKLNR